MYNAGTYIASHVDVMGLIELYNEDDIGPLDMEGFLKSVKKN